MTEIPSIDDLSARITGHRFPGGEITFAPHEVWLGNDAMDAPGASTTMNPLWFLLVALRGMGTTIGELVQVAETTMDDGVLFGEMAIEQASPLVPGERCSVQGGIDGIVRRTGRSGVFDVMEFSLDVRNADGEQRGRVVSSFILQRQTS